MSLKRGPNGLSSAQAQKFTAKPTVASASISQARPGTGAGSGADLSSFVLNGSCMPFLSLRSCSRTAPGSPPDRGLLGHRCSPAFSGARKRPPARTGRLGSPLSLSAAAHIPEEGPRVPASGRTVPTPQGPPSRRPGPDGRSGDGKARPHVDTGMDNATVDDAGSRVPGRPGTQRRG
ncbi:hypothetical protein GCM10009549_37310 [Streptomyces thermoalcalitolerans]|uniref:Uncharacterized protein n=1 Tax=Streptomyces thermoalcalitolerans TaxID=65605 RepID=A0ABP3ZBY6_9ACTN